VCRGGGGRGAVDAQRPPRRRRRLHRGDQGVLGRTGAFDDRAEHLLQLFAQQAAILLVNTQTLADARRTNLQLTDALENRDVIGQAKGILLAEGAADDTAAFAVLIAASEHANTKVHTVARRLVNAVTTRNANRRR
jgi:GAF domain-containing protein